MIGSARRAQPVPGFVFTGPVTARSRGTRRGGSGQRCVCAGPVPWLQAACEREPGARAEAAGAWVPLFRWGRPGTTGLPGPSWRAFAGRPGQCVAGALYLHLPAGSVPPWCRHRFAGRGNSGLAPGPTARAGLWLQPELWPRPVGWGISSTAMSLRPHPDTRPWGAQPREGCAAWVAWQGSPRGTASRSPGHGRAIVSLRQLVHCFRSAVGTPPSAGPSRRSPLPRGSEVGAQQSSLAVTVVVLELCCV